VTAKHIPLSISKIVNTPQSLDDTDPVFAAFMDMTDLGVVIFDKSMNLEYYNAKATQYFELSADDFDENYSYISIVQKLAGDGAFGTEDTPTKSVFSKDEIAHRLATLSEQPQTLNITMPSGRHLHLHQRLCGERFLITAQDVTQSELQKDILAIALEAGRSGYTHYNCETMTFEINSEYLQQKLSPKQINRAFEKGFFAIIHPEDRMIAQNQWEKALKTGQKFDMVCRIETGRGHNIWVRFYCRPQYSNTGYLVGFICFFEDISEELQTRDELRKAKEIAEKSLKMKNDFLAKLAHEIRTPMNGVIGIADALIYHNSDDTINPKLELIQSSADKILRIVDETLNHAKLYADKLTLDSKPGSPARSVEEVIKLWEQKALKNNIKLTLSIDPSVPEDITFDKFRYEQCINNLISNAIKFTPNGIIRVILTTAQKEGSSPRLVLAVQDNGIGMTDEQQAQIFEAYTQGDKSIAERFGGTGLGMTITKEIIELMGGAISVRSELGKGTVFALTLPYEDQSREEVETELVDTILEKAKPEPTNYSNLRVLAADDNSTNHLVIKSLIETVVAEVHLVTDGQQAIDVLKTKPIDVILMDIHMPVMDGIEATLSIRSSDEPWSDVKIIALTADPQYQQKRLCKNIGMDDALAKPVKLSDILGAFDRVLDIKHNNVIAA